MEVNFTTNLKFKFFILLLALKENRVLFFSLLILVASFVLLLSSGLTWASHARNEIAQNVIKNSELRKMHKIWKSRTSFRGR